eukprot:3184343-Amphidinium_carterae.1
MMRDRIYVNADSGIESQISSHLRGGLVLYGSKARGYSRRARRACRSTNADWLDMAIAWSVRFRQDLGSSWCCSKKSEHTEGWLAALGLRAWDNHANSCCGKSRAWMEFRAYEVQVIKLVEKGFKVAILDNLSNSSPKVRPLLAKS